MKDHYSLRELGELPLNVILAGNADGRGFVTNEYRYLAVVAQAAR